MAQQDFDVTGWMRRAILSGGGDSSEEEEEEEEESSEVADHDDDDDDDDELPAWAIREGSDDSNSEGSTRSSSEPEYSGH
jgi:hypothetical protein